MFLSDVADQLTTEHGWNMPVCDLMWLIASVDTFEEEPEGIPVYLGRAQDNYCWFYEFDDGVFVFDRLADAKAELARADTATTIPLFLVNLGDLLRYGQAEHPVARAEAVEQVLSRPFFRYLGNRSAWVSDKRGKK